LTATRYRRPGCFDGQRHPGLDDQPETHAGDAEADAAARVRSRGRRRATTTTTRRDHDVPS
jgi:hypothetical protein